MVYGLIQNKPVKEAPNLQGEAWRGWRSLKWLGEAIIVLTVPGGLVLWLGREVLKRGAFSTGRAFSMVGTKWINRKLTWTLYPLEKVPR